MNNLLFVKIKESVAQWIKDNEEKFKSARILLEMIENSEELIYLILSFGECMASIVVAKPDFTPYRFVAFEAVTIENGTHKMVYSWYDEDGTSVEEIIKNLDKAIDIVAEYNTRLDCQRDVRPMS